MKKGKEIIKNINIVLAATCLLMLVFQFSALQDKAYLMLIAQSMGFVGCKLNPYGFIYFCSIVSMFFLVETVIWFKKKKFANNSIMKERLVEVESLCMSLFQVSVTFYMYIVLSYSWNHCVS